jgi:hypothetical protein
MDAYDDAAASALRENLTDKTNNSGERKGIGEKEAQEQERAMIAMPCYDI